MDHRVLMKRFLSTLIVFVFLSCGNEITTTEELRNNPLDAEQATYETPALVFFPSEFTPTLGGSFQTEVFAMGPENLRGANVVFQYDQNKLSILNITVGGLSAGSNPLFFVDTDTPGIVEIVSVSLNADSISINQNLSIAQISFTATSTGQSTLDFQPECEMLDPDGNSIEIKGFGQGVVDAQ